MKAPIFYYHSVGGPPPQTLALAQFRRHLDAIRHHGYQTLTVSELLEARDRLPPRAVALAFDDGLLDNYEHVFPLLQEYGLRATFYVVPGYDNVTRWVAPHTGQWSDVAAPGYTIPFENMRADHRRELARHGMEIGSHSLTHRNLRGMSPAELAREVGDSRDVLAQEIGASVKTFCYPRGRFSPAVVRAVREAGYLGACSTIPGYYRPALPRYTLPRFLVEDPQYFETVLTGRAFRPSPLLRLVTRYRSWGRAKLG
jgi:peptidoglycan/xylan/chitin deacetylase (PgdA/CDA1 family)